MERVEDYDISRNAQSHASQERDGSVLDPATGGPDLVAIARDAFKQSTDYFDANIRRQIEKNIALFNSRHPQGSKYHLDSYKFRSKLFRPKVRTTIRRHEAAAAVAFFSTLDAVSTLPEDSSDEESVQGARFGRNWLNYRLEHSVPWFQTVIGGYQDAMAQGVVISRQEWVFKEKSQQVQVEAVDPRTGLVEVNEEGKTVWETKTVYEVVEDYPDVVLIPVENFRFSTAADWRDPIGTSPFLIEMIPMYVGDIKERMERETEKPGEPKWHKLTDGEIKSGNKTGEYDRIRREREDRRQDSTEEDYQLQQFDVVWVHRNIIRIDGEDKLFYTIGTEYLLSDPKPLNEVYLHGRPYAMGSAILETHKTYSSGLPALLEDLTTEANDIANQRLDNVKLTLNKRYRGRRGANVDWKALTKSVPGGIILMDDLKDVEEEKFSDVTASSYQEQERIDTDFDALAGGFNSGSVQNRRSANDTVGGMSMAMDDSNALTEYQLRCYTETWVESVLRQLMDMGRRYEDDKKVLKIAGEGATPTMTLALMDQQYKVRVSMGFGSTTPQKRIERLSLAISTIVTALPGERDNLNGDEIKKEVFGAMGYRDGKRFFNSSDDENPQTAALKQKIKELEGLLQGKRLEVEGKVQVATIKRDGDLQKEEMRLTLTREMAFITREINYIKEQIKAESIDVDRGELLLQERALSFKMRQGELESLSNDSDKMSSVLMNDDYGVVPAAEG